MDKNLIIKNNEFPKFLNQLAIDLTNFYFKKLNKPFKVNNKLLGKGYDPVTTCDKACLLYTSPSPRDRQKSRMPSSA